MQKSSNQIKTNNIEVVAGVDEVGRGALAGPVVTTAIILTKDCPINELKDSKELSEKKRNDLYIKLLKTTPYIRTAIINNNVIDTINILNATLKGMLYCVKKLKKKAEIIYIDGNQTPKDDNYNMEAIIKGDRLVPAISAASIIAKVTRDKIMSLYDNEYPQYHFKQNKGYGTNEHIESILTFGRSKIHRKTFNVKKQLSLFG